MMRAQHEKCTLEHIQLIHKIQTVHALEEIPIERFT